MFILQCEVSAVTRNCLVVLKSTLATVETRQDENNSNVFWPLFGALCKLVKRRNIMPRPANLR
jgi:hypothetical protein